MKYPIIDSNQVKMSPTKVILRFENILKRDGVERALKSDSFKKVRESWVAGLFCLGYAKLTKKKYWIQEIASRDEPPDLIIYSYRNPQEDGELGVVKEQMITEIVEYPIHSKYDLVGHIKTKLKDKRYHSETWLICYIQRPGDTMRLIDVIKELKKIKPLVREIWLLFHTKGKLPSHFHIARVYSKDIEVKKTAVHIQGNYVKLSQKPQEGFLNDFRGLDKEVTIRPGKIAIVPLPKDKTKKKIE
jgi:hypothetical protein